MRVLDVRKALLAVSEMVDADHDVIFRSEARGGSYAIHHPSGIRTPFIRRHQVYEIEATVLPYSRKREMQKVDPLAQARGSEGNDQRAAVSAPVVRK